MEWKYTEYETPLAYETGDWDGKRSDEVVAENDLGEKFIARVYEGFMDGSKFLEWFSENDYEIINIVRWLKIPE